MTATHLASTVDSCVGDNDVEATEVVRYLTDQWPHRFEVIDIEYVPRHLGAGTTATQFTDRLVNRLLSAACDCNPIAACQEVFSHSLSPPARPPGAENAAPDPGGSLHEKYKTLR